MVGWKFTKFLMSYLKPQVSFSLDFVSLFSVMRDNSSILFSLKLYIIWTKGAHQSAKFQTFDCSREISPNLYFHRLLFLKVYKISAKESIEQWCLMALTNEAKFEEKLKTIRRSWFILIWALDILKNFHFDWLLLCKVYNVWTKQVQRSFLSWHWKMMQNLKKNWLVV